jgi:hypothetical protein
MEIKELPITVIKELLTFSFEQLCHPHENADGTTVKY